MSNNPYLDKIDEVWKEGKIIENIEIQINKILKDIEKEKQIIIDGKEKLKLSAQKKIEGLKDLCTHTDYEGNIVISTDKKPKNVYLNGKSFKIFYCEYCLREIKKT